MRLRERLEHFGDALILLAQADGSRDPQDAAHQLLAQFVRSYLANARRHNEALAKLDRMIKAEMSLKPELAFLPLVRKLIAAHRPLMSHGFVRASRLKLVGSVSSTCLPKAASKRTVPRQAPKWRRSRGKWVIAHDVTRA